MGTTALEFGAADERPVSRGPRIKVGAPLTCAIAVTLCAAVLLAVNVKSNYSGHLTGLFYTGAKASLPPELGPQHTHRVNDADGYDAQFYHLVAHDPLILRGFSPYVDNPRVRWRRVGLPGLAALFSAGSDRYVDLMYIAIQIAFVFLGAFWLSRWTARQGRHPALGLAFLLIPAVAVSLDRMTVDLPLAALCIGFIMCAGEFEDRASPPRWPVYLILAAAPLVRETGMLLIIAWFLYSVVRRWWSPAALGAACALPAVAWWIYVHSRTPVDGTPWLSRYPFSGLIDRTIHGSDAPLSTEWLRRAAALEDLALLGIWLAFLLVVYLVWRSRWGLIETTAVVFLTFASTLGKFDIWSSAYATGRTMSPLLIMLGLLAIRSGGGLFAMPLLLILPRLALQYEAQFKGALRAIF